MVFSRRISLARYSLFRVSGLGLRAQGLGILRCLRQGHSIIGCLVRAGIERLQEVAPPQVVPRRAGQEEITSMDPQEPQSKRRARKRKKREWHWRTDTGFMEAAILVPRKPSPWHELREDGQLGAQVKTRGVVLATKASRAYDSPTDHSARCLRFLCLGVVLCVVSCLMLLFSLFLVFGSRSCKRRFFR